VGGPSRSAWMTWRREKSLATSGTQTSIPPCPACSRVSIPTEPSSILNVLVANQFRDPKASMAAGGRALLEKLMVSSVSDFRFSQRSLLSWDVALFSPADVSKYF
jgi:hypothetical protein